MNLIETMYGQELFDTANCKVSVFAVPCKIFNTFQNEMHLESACKKNEIPLNKNSHQGRFSAWAEEARSDLGAWNKATYDVADGMIFKIFVHKHMGLGERTYNVCQFIRARKEAAFRELKIRLSNHPKARFQNAVIKGRFDLLSLEEAVKQGVKVNAAFKHTFNPSDVERIIEVTVLEKEKAPTSIVRERVARNSSGEKIVVHTKRRVRAFELDDED